MSAQDLIDRQALLQRFEAVRAETLRRAAPLSVEDKAVQSMPDASPTKWHLAHTTWFFEVMVLIPYRSGYEAFDARYLSLFNLREPGPSLPATAARGADAARSGPGSALPQTGRRRDGAPHRSG